MASHCKKAGADVSLLAFLRREDSSLPAELEQHIVNFDELEERVGELAPDIVCCCLGTTIKQAGSREAFSKVDYQYPYSAALGAKSAKAYLLVSAMGASEDSLFFYSRVKGRLESDLAACDFNSYFFRPSLLLGERETFRAGEAIAGKVFPLLNRVMPRKAAAYKAIQGEAVALSMTALCMQLLAEVPEAQCEAAKPKPQVFDYNSMQQLISTLG